MKAFVTGGTGFIGKQVIRKLIARGYEVNALARGEEGMATIRSLGAQPVLGSLEHRSALRAGMSGCDLVFHIAAWYKIGGRDSHQAELINVEGTRNVLEVALEEGIPRVVYTSTVAVFGDTHGKLVDETCPAPKGPFLTEYDRTKWLAHYEVAVPLIEKGAPIIIVMPGAVYGPGDTSLVGEMMRSFYRGLLPVLPGPELTLAYAHVDDIAEGIILAAEKGKIGESYILTGPILPMSEVVKVWASVTGKPAPRFQVPARYLTPFAPFIGALGKIFPLPLMISQDSVSILNATYMASSEKARRELGWQLRPLQAGFQETFSAIAQAALPPAPAERRNRQAAGLVIGAAVGLLLVWLVYQKRKK